MKKTLFLDLESIPAPEEYRESIEVSPPGNITKQETIDKWWVEKAPALIEKGYRDTSFNGGYGQICQISWAVDDGEISGEMLGGNRSDEKEMLAAALATIEMQLGAANNPYLCGHYISGFDLKFIKHRCIVLGIHVPQWLKPNAKPWDEGIRDTMILWAGARDTISLDNLCKILGIEGKSGFDGSMVYDAWLAGEHQKISDYCASDVEKVRQVNKRFLAAGI